SYSVTVQVADNVAPFLSDSKTFSVTVNDTQSPFTVTNTANTGVGSLRQAITSANSTPGADTINFNIPVSGVQTIAPTSALPTITEAVTIDGYSQPGASPNTLAASDNAVLLVNLNGASAGSGVDGLLITAASSTIQGLIINGFSGNGVDISGAAAT